MTKTTEAALAYQNLKLEVARALGDSVNVEHTPLWYAVRFFVAASVTEELDDTVRTAVSRATEWRRAMVFWRERYNAIAQEEPHGRGEENPSFVHERVPAEGSAPSPATTTPAPDKDDQPTG